MVPVTTNQSTTTGVQTFKLSRWSPGSMVPGCCSGCSSTRHRPMDVYRIDPENLRISIRDLTISQFNFWIFISIHLICIWPDFLAQKFILENSLFASQQKSDNHQRIINESSTNHRKSSNNHQTPSIENHKKNHRTSSKILEHHPKIIQTSNIQQVLRPVLRPVWIPSTSSAAWPAAIRRQWQSHRRSPCSRNWRRVGGQRAWWWW